MCADDKYTHGQRSITCLASGEWSSYDYACCDCDTSFTVTGDCECFKIRGPKKTYPDAIDLCFDNKEQVAVIGSAEQLQSLSGIATSEIIRIAGKYSNSKWIFDDTVLDWIDNLPNHLKAFSSDPASLAFQMIGNKVALVDISYGEKKDVLCQKP
ncbi:uncharacterized protein LOC110455361 [Mizuhopecten yessoensis]|uniref:uncharacterized protein LOC110455361 n=1 Tax=Mizuhopecten yessoensis TaxID=6573 RepID=UPI000B45944F|nr:uncharacterized protein LOC110455361 [Mizuhopecten yessoensis]